MKHKTKHHKHKGLLGVANEIFGKHKHKHGW
jgi:hypothetical protein